MKKALVIFLISIHLAGNTELGQAFRLPVLISHYMQHHRQNSDIDFFKFLAMHYGGDDGTTADDELDSKLPCHNFSHNTISLVFSTLTSAPEIQYAAFTTEPDHNSILHPGISSKHVLLLLQPPRV